MSRLAVLGAGAGGQSAVVELALAGHEVRLWNRRPETLASMRVHGAVRHSGVFGTGEVRPALVTTDLAEALVAVEAVVVCLPVLAHGRLFGDLAGLRITSPMVLNPGQTGGVLHARAVFAAHGAVQPPTVEFSTLTYVARVTADGAVTTTSRANIVRAGCLPGHEVARDWGLRLFPGAVAMPDVLASSLSNVNLVLHPPGAVLASAWVEATRGAFRFYVDSMTPGVARVLELLDVERLSVAMAYGHALLPLIEEMAAIGTANNTAAAAGDVVGAVGGGEANSRIMAPDSFEHRYYREDLAFGLKPFLALAHVVGVRTPVAGALLSLGSAAARIPADAGLDAHGLGIAGMSLHDLSSLVRT